MSDPTPTPDQQPGSPPAEAQNTDTHAEHMIPKSRFDEVNKEARELREWKAQQERAAREAADKAAAEKGEFEKLATERGARLEKIEAEHKTATAQRDAYAAEMERQIKARLRTLPDEIKAMAPDGDALTRFAWLEKAEAAAAKLAATATPGTPRGPQGSGAAPSAGSANTDLIAEKRARIGGL